MATSEPPFKYLDEAAIAEAMLNRDPYDFAFVEKAIRGEFRDQILADVPKIPDRGSYSMNSLDYGPSFGAVLQELMSERFRHVVEKKFDLDLSRCPPVAVMMGNTSGRYNEGYAHPDSKHKIITILVGFTPYFPYERGRLRVLRSSDREDMAFEFTPEFGHMLLFRVCDHSWHGFLPQKAQRMSLQLCYVDSEWYVWRENWRHQVSAVAKSIPFVKKIIDLAPRRIGRA